MTLRQWLTQHGVYPETVTLIGSDEEGYDARGLSVGVERSLLDPVLLAIVPGYTTINLSVADKWRIALRYLDAQLPASFGGSPLSQADIVQSGTTEWEYISTLPINAAGDTRADVRSETPVGLGGYAGLTEDEAEARNIATFAPDSTPQAPPSAFVTGQTIDGVYYTPQELSEGRHLLVRTLGPPLLSTWGPTTAAMPSGSLAPLAPPPASPLVPIGLGLALAKLLGAF